MAKESYTKGKSDLQKASFARSAHFARVARATHKSSDSRKINSRFYIIKIRGIEKGTEIEASEGVKKLVERIKFSGLIVFADGNEIDPLNLK